MFFYLKHFCIFSFSKLLWVCLSSIKDDEKAEIRCKQVQKYPVLSSRLLGRWQLRWNVPPCKSFIQLLHEARNCASKGTTFRCKFLWLTISFSAICKLCIVFYRASRKARKRQNLSHIFKTHNDKDVYLRRGHHVYHMKHWKQTQLILVEWGISKLCKWFRLGHINFGITGGQSSKS